MFTSTTGQWWGALFSALLLVACVTDVRERRIPNVLVLVILAAGFGFTLVTRAWPSGVLASLAGVGLGFGIWIGFWLLGLLGAGDVKFFAAAGAWLGPAATWKAALMAALFGGVLAVVSLLRKRELKGGLERTAMAVSARSLNVLAPVEPDAAPSKQHLPYGVALAGGLLVVAWFPNILG